MGGFPPAADIPLKRTIIDTGRYMGKNPYFTQFTIITD